MLANSAFGLEGCPADGLAGCDLLPYGRLDPGALGGQTRRVGLAISSNTFSRVRIIRTLDSGLACCFPIASNLFGNIAVILIWMCLMIKLGRLEFRHGLVAAGAGALGLGLDATFLAMDMVGHAIGSWKGDGGC